MAPQQCSAGVACSPSKSSVLWALVAYRLLVVVAGTAVAPPEVGPRVLLKNSANSNTTMPLVGLGMPLSNSYAAVGTFLAIGGRRTDSAISYTGAEPGIGLSMREWIADGGDRAELFIGSKVGPGGACWPLGYNESISQAKMILGYYNQLNSTAGRSPPAVASVGQLDTLLVHWPVNGQRGGAVFRPEHDALLCTERPLDPDHRQIL